MTTPRLGSFNKDVGSAQSVTLAATVSGVDATGSADSKTALQSVATGMAANGGTIRFTAGTYNISAAWYLQDNTLMEVDAGAQFPNATQSNVDADTTVLHDSINKPAARKSWLAVSSNDLNEFTTYTSLVIASQAGTAGYEKAAGYDCVLQYDATTYTIGANSDAPTVGASGGKDAVGRQMSAKIAASNAGGRAWGFTAGATALAGGDGLLTGGEMDVYSTVSQGQYSRFNSKVGAIVVSLGTAQVTTGYLGVSSNGSTNAFYDMFVTFSDSITRYFAALYNRSGLTQPYPVLFAVDNVGNTTTAKLTATGVASFAGGMADASFSAQTPTTGFSITVANGVSTLQLTPAGTLASGTITMPSAPVSGQWLIVASTKTITSVTFTPNSGQSIVGAPTTINAGAEISFQYQVTSWVCQQSGAGGGGAVTAVTAANGLSLTSGTLALAVANGTTPGAVQPDGTTVTVNGAGVITATGGASTIGLFGTGTDGSVTLSAGTTTMQRDMCYNNLTIPSGAYLNTNGYVLRVSGVLDISAASTGAIFVVGIAGGNASGATAGTGASAGGAVYASLVPTLPCGGAGANGGAGGTTSGSSGSQSSSSGPYSWGANGGYYGGGSGGSGSSGSGGGTIAGPAPYWSANSSNGLLSHNPWGQLTCTYFTQTVASAGNAGGSGGGGDGTHAGGGGGGGGGGASMLAVFADTIARGTNTNTAIILSSGGAGGNGAAGTGGNAGGGGGGGGGWGSLVRVVARTVTGSVIANAVQAAGGAGGSGGNGVGTGNGGYSGGAGASGSVIVTIMSSPSGSSLVPCPGGTTYPQANSGATGGVGPAGRATYGNL